MLRNLLSTIPSGVGAGLQVWGAPQWGLLGSDILAASAAGEHGPGLAANDGLTPGLRYVYQLESRSSPGVLLYPDSSHEGPVPYSGIIRLFEEGTGEVAATEAARTFSVTVAVASVAPSITVQPQAQSVAEGASATFSVVAAGTAPLAYQWRRNGLAISGATASSYTLAGATLADSGAVFSVLVSNSAGSATSAGAALTVTAATVAPSITVQPQAQSVTEGGSATFSVVAAGTAPLAYQWRRNGLAISGATASSYTLAGATLADSGAVFSVLVSNAAGSVASAGAVLTVTAAVPAIVMHPAMQAVEDGDMATFTVLATGAQPLVYQWQRNGLDIAGATGPTLQLGPVNLLDNRAAIRVRVTNELGSVLSRKAELRVPVVSVATARAGARIDDDRFDADIPRWCDAALTLAEQHCNRYFGPKTPVFELPAWPAQGHTFPVYAARAATVSYWDGSDWVTLQPADYVHFPDGNRTGIAPATGTAWPELGPAAGGPRVRVQLVVGPATAAEVPEAVVHFVIAHVALWADENRAAGPNPVQHYPWLYAGLDALKVY